MKKRFFLILSLAVFFNFSFILASSVDAQSSPQQSFCPAGGICIDNPLKAGSLQDIFNTVINFIFIASLAIAPLLVIVAAYYLMTSGGNPTKVNTAKLIILYTAVGLLVIFLAKGLVSLIKSAF